MVSQHGRPDDGTDTTGFFNAEFFVPLKPFDTWPHGMNKAKLTKILNDDLTQPASRAWTSTSRRTSRTTSRRPHPA